MRDHAPRVREGGVMPFREALRTLLEASPRDGLVPVPHAWLRALLETAADAPALPPADLCVADVAARWRRSESFVRALLAHGAVPGAHQQHGRWLVPVDALLAYEDAQRASPPVVPEIPVRGERPRRVAPDDGSSAFEQHLRRRRSA
jgi:hypothetical protein